MNLRQMMILATWGSLALVTTGCVSGQSAGAGLDLLEKQSWQLAGPGAVDCGRVPLRSDPTSATDCAMAANKAGKPFRVLYDMQGIDSYVAEAYVRSPDGTLQALMWDSDPAGGGRRGPGVVNVMQCPTPVHFYATAKGQLTCVPPKPPARLNTAPSTLNRH
jgi:hypothetical protein